jgi:HEAT repeat protein
MGSLATLVLLLLVLQDATPDDAKIRNLIGQLGSDFLEDRQAARKSLEKEGRKSEGMLVQALEASDHRVRRECLDLLITLKSTAALSRAASLFQTDENLDVQDAAFRLFQALGREAETPLIAALDSPIREFRRRAIQTLTDIRSERCAEKMESLFDRETDKEIRDAAFHCLRSLGKPAEPFLIKCLTLPEMAMRRDALRGLKDARNDVALAAVGQLYAQEADAEVIEQAYEILAGLGARGEPHFLAGLRSPQEQTRLRSVEGLRNLKSEKAPGPVAELFQNDPAEAVRAAAVEFLKGCGLKAEETLMRGLAGKEVKIRLLAIDALGEIGSAKPLDEIARIFREDKDREIHGTAFKYLKNLGIRAEKHLLEALADEEKEIRRQAVLALGDAKSEAAIGRLIDFMAELDPDMKAAAERALARIGPKAIDAIAGAVAAGHLRKHSAGMVTALYHQEEVERLLDALVTDSGGSGFFEGQFREIQAFGKDKALPALLLMVGDPKHKFRRVDRLEKIWDYGMKMRELAVMALGELGDERVVETLRKALKATPLLTRSDTIHEELLVALYRHGEKQPLEDFVQKTRAEAPKAEENASLLFSLGIVLNRVGRRQDAAEAYLEFLKILEQHPGRASDSDTLQTTFYNLACLSSLQGDKDQALKWLDKAVRAGFVDRAWIRMDRDLDPIRSEAAFRAWIEDDRLFEQKPRNP